MNGFILFPPSRRSALLLASVLFLAALHPAPCSAQSDDDDASTAPPVTTPRKAPPDSFHGHGGGGDDDNGGRSSFRDDRGPNRGMRIESTAGTGLALDRSSLPGELGPTPETSRPLFGKPTDGLTMRPDPWDLSSK
jgi:hypothetical protein